MNAITISGVTFLLIIPVMAAAVLAVLPGYRLSASLNMAAAFLTLLAALSLFIWKPATGPYILVDDLNIVFVVLNSFVGFTTSVFSASWRRDGLRRRICASTMRCIKSCCLP
jgi:hydrogenase-4 component F